MVFGWFLAGRAAMAFPSGRPVARTSRPGLTHAQAAQFLILASLINRGDHFAPVLPSWAGLSPPSTPCCCRVSGSTVERAHVRKYSDASEERTAAIRFESPDAGQQFHSEFSAQLDLFARSR